MDFIEEYNEMSQLPNHILATYTFFKAFRVDKETEELIWNKFVSKIPSESIDSFRKFLKKIREDLRQKEMTPGQCSKAMFFMYQKILELGAFTIEERAEILRWMEICELIVM